MKTKWFASLSDGSTVYEEKGDFKTIKGELSPWQRLLKHLDNGIKITSISLYTDDGKRFNLPSAGKNPKFKEFAEAPKPTSYNFFRKAGADIMNGKAESYEVYAVIEAIYPDKKLQLWVSESNSNNSWAVIV
jgi:hypothetical protein